MEHEDRSKQYRQYAEWLIKAAVEEGVAGCMIGPDGLTLGEPNWEERTKHQRFSERVKTHGYPLGFAKSLHRIRD